ncbi:MAG TPA: J domain-containing protein [Solirubrobacteraceae bacterium]|nr:J domain-containing protein [Solirubrobacteraceae bacterium]
MALTDPYKVLGIPHSATDAEIRAAYRRQVQLHHPDHNGGSAESTRRFEQVQEAYALILRLDRGASSATSRASARQSQGPTTPPQAAPSDPGLEQRLADLERELAAQRAAKQQAAREAERIRADALRQAREATRATGERASDEDLGYVTTDDSISAILDDAAEQWSKRLMGDADDDGEREPVNERLADLLDDLGARLRGERPGAGDRRRDED